MNHYRESVFKLAKEVGATVVEEAEGGTGLFGMPLPFDANDSYSDPDDMTVHVPYVSGEREYAAALHELGHLHYQHRRLSKMDAAALLDTEAEATEWAMEHYEGEPTKEAFDLWGAALSTYMNVYRFRWTEPTKYFQTLNNLLDWYESFMETDEEKEAVREMRKMYNEVRTFDNTTK